MVSRSPHPFSRVCAGQSPWSGFLRRVAMTTTVMYLPAVGQQVCTFKPVDLGQFPFSLLSSLHSREETPKAGCFPRWPCRYMAMKFASLPFLCTSEHANTRPSVGACWCLFCTGRGGTPTQGLIRNGDFSPRVTRWIPFMSLSPCTLVQYGI